MHTQDFNIRSNITVGVTTVAFSKNELLVQTLKNAGFKNVKTNQVFRRLSKDELLTFLADCDSGIIGLDKIDEEVTKRLPNLKVISKYGVGLDNIDLQACANAEIEVIYSQGVNKRSVSEMALGFILGLMRNLYVTSNSLKQGKWNKNGGSQLSGKTVGVIGVGNIGKDLIQLLQPFDCRVLVNDIIDQEEYYRKFDLVESSKERIFEECDVITIHTPLNSETKYMVNQESLSRMKPNAVVINTARGGIVNQIDLKNALLSGQIAGAAIDAYEIEPPEDKELIELPNLFCTPHIGGNSKEAVEAMGHAAINNLLNYYF